MFFVGWSVRPAGRPEVSARQISISPRPTVHGVTIQRGVAEEFYGDAVVTDAPGWEEETYPRNR